PPVLLCHATGFVSAVWSCLGDTLAHRGFRPIAPDTRGHGLSDKPASDYSWYTLAEDVYCFVEALGLRQVAAVGHSAGGTSLVVCEAQHSGTLGRIVLIDPVLRLPQERLDGRSHWLAEGARRRRMVWPSREEMVRSFRERPPLASWREDLLRAYVEAGTRLLPDGRAELLCPGPIEAQVYEAGGNLDPWPDLPRVRCPVLSIRGERSETFSGAAAGKLMELVSDCRVVTIPSAGHFVPMERPVEVAELVIPFLEDRRGATSPSGV
ncbi:MAG: alpha/beta hydrolase, partial [Chloroflexota bacterium]